MQKQRKKKNEKIIIDFVKEKKRNTKKRKANAREYLYIKNICININIKGSIKVSNTKTEKTTITITTAEK